MGGGSSKDHEKHFGKNKRKVVILGLEASGKTNFCKKLSEGKFIYDYITTDRPRFYEIQFEEQDWTLIDIGGTARSIMHWRNFLEGAHGIVFMIDASDSEKFTQVKYEIESLINNNYCTKSAMILFFNKQEIVKGDTNTIDKILVSMNISNRTLLENNILSHIGSLQNGTGFENAVRSLYDHMNDHIARKTRNN